MSDKQDPPNVIALTGGGKTSHLSGAIREAEMNLPLFVRFAELHAKVQRASFDALLKQGFTEAQALDLLVTIEL